MSNTETENICGLKRADFQTTINGKQTDLYILKNNLGHEIAVTNYGGAIIAIMVPDKDGNWQMSFKDMPIFRKPSTHQRLSSLH